MTPAPCRHAPAARLRKGLAAGDNVTIREMASLLAVPIRVLKWHCEQAGKLGKGSLFFGVLPCKDGTWLIPKRVALRVCNDWPLQHYTVAQVASFLAFSERWVRERIVKVPQGMDIEAGRPSDTIGARLFFDSDLRIPWSEIARIAGWPQVARRESSTRTGEDET